MFTVRRECNNGPVAFDSRFHRLLLGLAFIVLCPVHSYTQSKQPGVYRIPWNSGANPSGIYFCQFSAGVFSQTRKIALVR